MEADKQEKTDNELIAEFMGWQCDAINDVKIWYRIGVNRSISPGELKFNSSWDWLMPVCLMLGLQTVSTDIKTTYKNVIDRILEANKGL